MKNLTKLIPAGAKRVEPDDLPYKLHEMKTRDGGVRPYFSNDNPTGPLPCFGDYSGSFVAFDEDDALRAFGFAREGRVAVALYICEQLNIGLQRSRSSAEMFREGTIEAAHAYGDDNVPVRGPRKIGTWAARHIKRMIEVMNEPD